MKIRAVTFERRMGRWLCMIGYSFASSRQFTDEHHQVEASRRFWLTAYFAARQEMKLHIAVWGAKRGEREAKGWVA